MTLPHPAATAARWPKDRPLTARQQAFVREYLVDLNGSAAARRAGYAESRATNTAVDLLAMPRVQAAIAKAQAARARRTEITADMVLQRWWQIATADPNELVQHRRGACRYCHGDGHRYQWTEREYLAAVAAYEKLEQRDADAAGPPPDIGGGFGYDPTVSPHPACPECHGDGLGIVHAADTRHVTGPAALLYAGAKQTRDGLEIKLHDQLKALEIVSKHVGVGIRQEITGKNGGPIETAGVVKVVLIPPKQPAVVETKPLKPEGDPE